MKTVTKEKNECSIPEAAERLGVTRQAVYHYIERFSDDFLKADCIEVKKKGLLRKHKVKDFDCFLRILRGKGAEFEN